MKKIKHLFLSILFLSGTMLFLSSCSATKKSRCKECPEFTKTQSFEMDICDYDVDKINN
ncbi:MAG: hypothetical protein ACPG5B_14065 [Chitinophagales bacterium]